MSFEPKEKKSAVMDLSSLPIDEALKLLNKKYGANTVIIASLATAVITRVSTGVAALDYALGGGFVEGRITELHGPFSSFKTTVALVSVASFQRKHEDGMAIYIDLERTFDGIHAKRLGVDLERLLLVNPDSGEQAVNALNDLITINCPLWCVLDSLAALVPTAEIEAAIDQNQMGVQARLVNRMMRVLIARMKRSMYDSNANMVSIIVLNQLREKLGVMFGNPETTPGGKGKDFFYSVVVRLAARHSKAITKEITRNSVKKEIQFGQTVSFKVVKNKCGGPQHQQGEFMFYERDWQGHPAYSFNNDEAMFEYGAFTGVIELKPGVGFSFSGVVGKNQKKFIAALEKKRSVRQLLRRQIIAAMCDPSTFTIEEGD